ncbi:hypothetical protein NTGBS_220006 [Candidatus Nitrotoga sp. BS]|nr:hypothetical protein NTGBS_220006 [Candidatus Nitrotoga sp. BS]
MQHLILALFILTLTGGLYEIAKNTILVTGKLSGNTSFVLVQSITSAAGSGGNGNLPKR